MFFQLYVYETCQQITTRGLINKKTQFSFQITSFCCEFICQKTKMRGRDQVSLSSLEEAQHGTIVNQYQPSGIRGQFQLSKTARTASVLTTVLFFPFILWIPALVLSFRSQARYEKGEYQTAEKYAKYALGLCVLCAILGKIL